MLPMKSTVAPAEGERTKWLAESEERVCGVSSMWIVSVVLVTGSVGMEGLYVEGSVVDILPGSVTQTSNDERMKVLRCDVVVVPPYLWCMIECTGVFYELFT